MRETLLTSRYFLRPLKIGSDQYRGFEYKQEVHSSLSSNTCNAWKQRLNLGLFRNEALAALLTKLKRVSNRVFDGLDTLTRYFTTLYFTVPSLFSLDTSPAVTCLASGVWTPLLPAPHPHNVIYVDGVRYRQISAGHTHPYSVGGSATIGGTESFSDNRGNNDKFRKRNNSLARGENNIKIVQIVSLYVWSSDGRK